MNNPLHEHAAQEAAGKISELLNSHGYNHSIEVYGDPPTISLTLSVLAAHHIIDGLTRLNPPSDIGHTP